MAMINNGKTNVMPQHATRLSPEQIRVLAAYVWSLSHKGDKQTAMNAVNASAQ
jgi:cytochrome c oxidase cbb3-type subunit 3